MKKKGLRFDIFKDSIFPGLLFSCLTFLWLCPSPSQAQAARTTGPGSFWASIVLGQVDFSTDTTLSANNQHVCSATGVIVDRYSYPQRIYIYDSGNNRILGYSDLKNAITQANGRPCLGSDYEAVPQGADIVLGQPDFVHTGANGDSEMQAYPGNPGPPLPVPSANTLGFLDPRDVSPAESGSKGTMAVDTDGSLYVPDFINSRVLRYQAPVRSSQAADHVWGQPDFNSSQGDQGGGPTSKTLAFGVGAYGIYSAGVAVDPWHNLWVADSGNNRVVRFPYNSALGVPAPTADVVLGQADFNHNVFAANDGDWSHLFVPQSVRVDQYGNVFVADSAPATESGWALPGRVMIYHPTGLDYTGQPQYGTNNMGLAASGWITDGVAAPTGMEMDPQPGFLWVNVESEAIQYQLAYSSDPIPAVLSATPHELLAAAQILPNHLAGGASSADGPNFQNAFPRGEMLPVAGGQNDNFGGIGVDNSGNVFVCFPGDIYRYPNSPTNPIPTLVANGPGTWVVNLPNQPNEGHAADIVVCKASQWNVSYGLPNNLADNMGIPYTGGYGMVVAPSQSQTQLISSGINGIAFWNLNYSLGVSMGLSTNKTADGFANVDPALVKYVNFNNPNVVSAMTADQASTGPRLWVAQGNYIEYFNLPLTSWATAAATVFTSANPVSVLGMTPAIPVQGANGLAADPAGNYLWVSDQANNRVLRIANPAGPTPVIDIILGQKDSQPTSNQPNQGGSPTAYTLNQPSALTIDHHNNLYVTDSAHEAGGNGRLLQYANIAATQNTTGTVWTANPASSQPMTASNIYANNGSFAGGCASFPNPSLSPCHPFQAAFNQDDSVMVVGAGEYAGSHYPVVFSNPLTNFNNPTTFLNDWQRMGGVSSQFDSQGNLFWTDSDSNRLLIYLNPFPQTTPPPQVPYCSCPAELVNYTPSGTTIWPEDMTLGTVAGVTTLFTSDYYNGVVWENNVNNPVPNPPYLSANLGRPYGVALNPAQTSLFVANNWFNDVVKFDLVHGTQPVSFGFDLKGPVGLTVDTNGDVYVVDTVTMRKYHQTLPNQYKEVASLPGSPLYNAQGVLVQGNNVYIADTYNHQIERWKTTDGLNYFFDTIVYQNSAGPAFAQMTQEPGTTRVHVVSLNDAYMVFDSSTTPWTLLYACNPLQGGSPSGVAVDANYLYLNNMRFNKPAANCYSQYGLAPPPTNTPTPTPALIPCTVQTIDPVPQPMGVAIDSNGVTLYAADDQDQAIAYFYSGGSGIVSGSGSVSVPIGVAVDSNGLLYVSDEALNKIFFFGNGAPPSPYGGPGTGLGQFQSPAGLAVTANGSAATMYVADEDNGRLQVIPINSGTMGPVSLWGMRGFENNNPLNSPFVDPVGVALDASGNVYVADAGTFMVYKFSSGGSVLTEWDVTAGTGLYGAEFVAVGSNGVVYVSDGFENVAEFDESGNWLGTTQGGNPGFGSAQGLAYGNNFLYVADNLNGSVDQLSSCPAGYTPTPTPVGCTPITIINSGSNAGMAIDYGHNRLLTTLGANLEVYNSLTAAPITTISSFGSGLSFGYPIDTNVDANGDIYVADLGNSDVEKFDSNYNYLCSIGNSIGVSFQPAGVWANGSSVFISDLASSAVYQFNEVNGNAAVYSPSAAATWGYGGGLNLPNGLAMVGQWLYVADQFNNRIVKCDTTNPGAPPVVVRTGLQYPAAVRTDLAGNFYVTENNNPNAQVSLYVDTFSPDFSTLVNRCPVPNGPWGVAVNQEGNVFVSEINSPYQILELQGTVTEPTITPTPPSASYTPTNTFTPTPTYTPAITPTPTVTITPVPCSAQIAVWGESQPQGLALNSNATTLYVADDATGFLDAFNFNGDPMTSLDPHDMAFPVGVAVDGSGTIYVTDLGDSVVWMLTSTGYRFNYLGSWPQPGQALGQFFGPAGIAVTIINGTTTMFVADALNSRVQEFTSTNGGSNWVTVGTPGDLGNEGTNGNGTLAEPWGLALDGNGNLYVADDATGLVQQFNVNTGLWTGVQWDATAGTPLVTAQYIAVDPACGLAYVSDGEGSVGLFRPSSGAFTYVGNLVGDPGLEETTGVVVGGGAVYAADDLNNQIYAFSQCNCSLTAVPTPIWTSLPLTPTYTWTPSWTPTPGPSLSPTWTPTNSMTNTPTFTPTYSQTLTPTNSQTWTPTFSQTWTPTFSQTWTPTYSRTYTPTFTNTWTPSNTRTFTQTFTPTQTPTFTRTSTPTATKTITMTGTRTFTLTNTPTFTRTFTTTATKTITMTGTRTFTPTNTPTFTRTFTRTFTPTVTRTSTPTATKTITMTGTRTFTPTNTPAANTPTKTYTPSYTPSYTPTPTPMLTFYPTPFRTITVSDSASGCVTVGQSISVTAIFGPANEQNQTDDYSIGFGNGTTIVWKNGCTASYNTGSLPSSKPVTVVQSVTVPATVTSGSYTTLDVVGIQDSTYLCGGSTILGNTSISMCPSGGTMLSGSLISEGTPISKENSNALQVVAAPNISRDEEPIKFLVSLDQPTQMVLTLYSLSGEKVYSTSAEGSSGLNTLVWELTNNQNQPVASGLYIYVLQTVVSGKTENHMGKVVIIH